MPAPTSLLREHNTPCERAGLSGCRCHCRGAGHQQDFIERAVSCTHGVGNNLAPLERDLEGVYGGFHTDFRDTATPSRRSAPEDLARMKLNTGLGASWSEKLLVDEGLHAAFLDVARGSMELTDDERQGRRRFVTDLAQGAIEIVGGEGGAQNIYDGHVWCSILAEFGAPRRTSAPSSSAQSSGPYGRICYPRKTTPFAPGNLSRVRITGLSHVQSVLDNHPSLVGGQEILRLIGAASCSDLWHHPAAVRYSLQPFVSGSNWPPNGSTILAKPAGFRTLEVRWRRRGNW